MKSFCLISCIPINNFKAVKFHQCQSVHKTSIVAKGFHLCFPGFIPSRFKIVEYPSFAAEDNFCLSSKLILVQLHVCCSLYDK